MYSDGLACEWINSYWVPLRTSDWTSKEGKGREKQKRLSVCVKRERKKYSQVISTVCKQKSLGVWGKVGSKTYCGREKDANARPCVKERKSVHLCVYVCVRVRVCVCACVCVRKRWKSTCLLFICKCERVKKRGKKDTSNRRHFLLCSCVYYAWEKCVYVCIKVLLVTLYVCERWVECVWMCKSACVWVCEKVCKGESVWSYVWKLVN